MTDRHGRDETAFRINLEQQKKRAKELRAALEAGDPAALARFRRHHPGAGAPEARSRVEGRVRLADAQLVVARELRLPSWPALRAHVARMDANRTALERGWCADGARNTLHIRCGSDVKETLTAAGFSGDFLEYANPFCQGPVVAGADWLERRIAFVAGAYADAANMSDSEVRRKSEAEETGLFHAAQRYERVVLWFEHDSYDQLILARCLAHFAEHGVPETLELVSVDGFPGGTRFIGIGQLPPEAFRLLWEGRRPVAAAGLDFGARVWAALRSADPTALHDLARSGSTSLPHMAPAILRHLQELPSHFNGMSLTEQLILECLRDGAMTTGQVYRTLMLQTEPLPWLGDLTFLHIVQEMLRAREPAVSVDADTGKNDWSRWRIALTGAGVATLAGKRDYMTLGPPERWVGGLAVRPGEPCWRWDAAAGAPVRVPEVTRSPEGSARSSG